MAQRVKPEYHAGLAAATRKGHRDGMRHKPFTLGQAIAVRKAIERVVQKAHQGIDHVGRAKYENRVAAAHIWVDTAAKHEMALAT